MNRTLPILLVALAACSIENTLQELDTNPLGSEIVVAELPPRPDADPAELQACANTAALIDGVAFDTVRDAIHAAALGDEIVVCPGTHDEAISLTQDVRLRAADRARDATVLLQTVFIDDGDFIELVGLTFRGEQSIMNARVVGSTDLLVLDGWMLSPPDSEPHTRGGVVASGNTTLGRVWGEGLGMVLVRQAPLDAPHDPDITILDSVFVDNHGGIQIDGPGTLTMRDVRFEESGGCGAITVAMGAMSHLPTDPTTIVAESVDLIRTRSEPSIYPDAGAVLIRDVDTLRCTDCTWEDNLDHDVATDVGVFDAPGATFEL